MLVMSRAKDAGLPSKPSRSRLPSLTVVGLVLVMILSLAFVGYSVLNNHTVAITQNLLLTNTTNLYSTQTQTVTSVGAVTSVTTVTRTSFTGFGYGNYPACMIYGCPDQNPAIYNNYNTCRSSGSNNQAKCYGYLEGASGGCVVLAVPIIDPYNSSPYTVYQYYTLHNLPSSYPPSGAWVTVTGQLNQGYTTSPTGAACPSNNVINVTSITQ